MERSEIDIDAWVAYLNDLQDLMRPEFTDERWDALFKRTDTPAQAAQKLAGISPKE